ncbi:MAG: hypothetical protein JWO40_677 [Candidatus Doudnabacteria bacterium]|nr:hypothetical protein [Candidatus Doudnabacteria bacterium]
MATLFKRRLVTRLTVFLLAFLFVIAPLAPVFADTSNTVISAPVSDTPSNALSSPVVVDTPTAPLTDPVVNTPNAAVPAPVTDPTVAGPDVAGLDPTTDSLSSDPLSATAKSSKVKVAPQSSALIQQDVATGLPQPTVTKQIIPQPDQTTGALVSSYPITIPPGRNGMQPDLKLAYNSQSVSGDSPVGYGWTTTVPYISRVNKKGVSTLFTDNYFNSSLSGDLSFVSGTTYASTVENGDFLKYNFDGTAWTVTDKKGTIYKFGTASGSRQDNPGDSSKVVKWMLDEVRDTNSNYITYTYYKDSGQIYPNTIIYTGNGVTTGIFEIDFLRQTRGDVTKSYQGGFLTTTNYRIYEIDIKTNGTITRKYTFAYSTGDNGTRSILTSITEAGTDEITTSTVTLPATTNAYTSTTSSGWTQNSSWSFPSDTSFDGRSLFADINGDGLPDIITSFTASNGTDYRATYLNNSSGTWTASSAYNAPTPFKSFNAGSNIDFNVHAIDVNGDGLADLIYSNKDSSGTITAATYINNGSGWTVTTAWTSPINFTYLWSDFGTRIVDLNGDGLPDIFQSNTISGGSIAAHVYLNTGSGWTSDVGSSWTFPVISGDNATFLDLNGDGLEDIIRLAWTGTTFNTSAYLGDGKGTWTSSTDYTPALTTSYLSGYYPSDLGVRFADVNGDGLPDLIQSINWYGAIYRTTYLNTGNGWTSNTTSWNTPGTFSFTNGYGSSADILDLNGDGMADITDGYTSIYINNSAATDLLSSTTFPFGGSSTFTYKSSALSGYNGLNPKLPYVIQTVYQVTSNDGLGTTGTDTYSNSLGSFYFDSGDFTTRKFAGFGVITKTDPSGNVMTSYFHQGNGSDSTHGEYSDEYWKIGKMYRMTVANSSGSLFSKVINRWDSYNLTGGKKFVRVTRTVTSTYDGDSTHRDVARTYLYNNSTGNVSQKTELGEVTGSDDGSYVDIGTDDFTTAYTYATDGANVIGLPDDISVTDHSATKVKEDKYYYDTQSFGAVTKGNQTKHEMWKVSTTFVNTQKTYDGTYGIVTVDTDPRGKTTSYSYDTYHLYPTTVTNPLSQVTTNTYDYSSGQVLQTTDPNTRVFKNVYDGLDRLVEQDQPDLITPSTLVTKNTTIYTDTSGAVKTLISNYLDSSTTVDVYTYFDGLGRKLQERTEAEGSNFSVKDYVYDSRGNLYKESLPYFSIGTTKTSPTITTALYTVYSYDPMNRITTSVNAAGTTTNTYNDWKLTVNDANSKVKDFYKNAYGNLIQVDEHNSGSTYSTYYVYDFLGDLLKITDASGNVRNFTYDGLGRNLTAQDLHASADATYGTWAYVYDDAGNLTQKVDALSQTTNYTFDNINRVLTEDYTGATGTENTYVYDTGTDGKGHLYSSTTSAVTQTNTYNPLGGLKSEIKVIGGNSYETDYTYDRQGNQLIITNPDSSQVKYIYNSAGLLNQVQRKESTDSSYSDVVTNFDYSPTGQISETDYANGIITANTYDAAHLYRLSNKLTTPTSSAGTPPTTPAVNTISTSWSGVSGSPQVAKALVMDPTNSTIEYSGTWNGIYKSTDSGTTWTQITSTSSWLVNSIAVDPLNHNTVYAATDWDSSCWAHGSVYKSTDAGTTWSEINSGLTISSCQNYIDLVVDPATSGTVYVVNDTTGIYKTTNSGTSWSKVYDPSGVTNDLPYDLVIDPTTPSTLYASVNTGVIKTTNSGTSWSRVFTYTLNSTTKMTALVIDPTSTSTIYVASVDSWSNQNHLYKTTNSGSTWTKITDLNGFVAHDGMIISPQSHTTLYSVFNGARVQTSTDGGTNWSEMSTGLPGSSFGNSVYALLFDPNTATLFATNWWGTIYSWIIGNTSIAPVINTFQATPANISSGHSSTLTWTVSGGTPTTFSIDNGVGGMFGHGSTSVSPTTTTTYTLTASNSSGSTTRTATVNFNPKFQDVSYTYDNVGNITAIVDNSTTNTKKNVAYGYDDLYRLASMTTTSAVNSNNHSETYTYDAIGNLLTKSDITGTYAYSGNTGTLYANPHAVTAIGSVGLTYDRNGNVLTKGTSYTNTWDYNNRLTQTVAGSTTIAYAYDANGERAKYVNGSTVVAYPTKLYNTDGTNITKHIFANGMDVATISGTGTTAVARNTVTDNLTGSNIVLNAVGAQDELLDYYPFGTSRLDEKAGTFSEQRKFAGHEFDADTGLTYMDARYYDQATGRFQSEDPAFLEVGSPSLIKKDTDKDGLVFLTDPQALNSYSYARNNPLKYTDPTGKFFGIDDLITLIVIGLLQPKILQADPVYEPQQYAQTKKYQPQFIFMGDMISVDGIPIPEGNVSVEGGFYRGGGSFDLTGRAGADFTVDPKTGYVGRTQGPSVNIDPANANVVKYGGANQIISIPDQLEILQGSNGHGSIVPKKGVNLTPKQFQESLNKIQTKPYEGLKFTPSSDLKSK